MRSERQIAKSTSNIPWGRIGLWIVGILAGGLLLYFVGRVLLLGFAGILLAIWLNFLSDWVSRNSSLSYRYSFITVVAVLVILMGTAVWRTQDLVTQQVQEFSKAFPESLSALRDRLEPYNLERWIPRTMPSPSDLAEQPQMWTRLTGLASGALTFFADVLVILFVGLYAAAEPRLYQTGVRLLVPPPRRHRADEVLHSLGCTLRWWMVGKICSMAVVGAAVGIGLWLLGIKFALLLGLIAAALELIPNFGPLLASVPAILIAWSQSSQSAFYVLLLYAAVQLAESYLVLPLIQRKAIQLPPALVILAVVMMAMLAGTLGAVVATPLLAVILVLVKMLYIEDYLGDQSVDVIGESAERSTSGEFSRVP